MIEEEIQLDESFDASDPESIEAAEKSESRKKYNRLRVVEGIMSHEHGRAWMNDFLGLQCHIFSENTMRDSQERNGRFEGERGVGLRVLAEVMEAAPEMFWVMRKEALERDKK